MRRIALSAPEPPGFGKALHLTLFAIALLYGAAIGFRAFAGVSLSGGTFEHPADFTAFYAAGRLALAGEAAAAFDWARHDVLVTALVGPDHKPQPWLNPPSFLLVAAPLALLPYGAAKLLFFAASLAAFASTLRAIGRHPDWLLAALAFPTVFAVGLSGQNGLLTASLLGGGLALLGRGRPVLAGILFGLLTIKPQLGILIPLALLAGGLWRTIASATATALALVALSAGLFGFESWPAFFASLPNTGDAMLGRGIVPFGKMQSLFGVLRHAGFGSAEAATAQALFGLAVAAVVWRIWRRPEAPFALKAAALALGCVLVQPYVYIYDEAFLAVAIAFMAGLGRGARLRPEETAGLALAGACLLAAGVAIMHLGFAAALLVAALTCRRGAELASPARLDQDGAAARLAAGPAV